MVPAKDGTDLINVPPQEIRVVNLKYPAPFHNSRLSSTRSKSTCKSNSRVRKDPETSGTETEEKKKKATSKRNERGERYIVETFCGHNEA